MSRWAYNGKVSRAGLMRKPGYILDEQFKKWLNFLLPNLIDKSVLVTIEHKVRKKSKAPKKLIKKKSK